MTFKELAMAICAREGKKRQVDIAQVAEVLKALRLLILEDGSALVALMRAPKRKKKS